MHEKNRVLYPPAQYCCFQKEAAKIALEASEIAAPVTRPRYPATIKKPVNDIESLQRFHLAMHIDHEIRYGKPN